MSGEMESWRILVVDDNPKALRILKDNLELDVVWHRPERMASSCSITVLQVSSYWMYPYPISTVSRFAG